MHVGTLRSAIVGLAVSCAAAAAGYVEVPLREAPEGAPHELRLVREGDVELVPVAACAAVYGFAWRYDMTARELVCVRGADTVVVLPGVPFCRVAGRTVALPVAPRRIGGDLYLPLRLVSDVFGAFSGSVLRWGPDNRWLALYDSPYTVASMSCAVESLSTRLSFLLTDSADVSVSYVFPLVVVAFDGATVDTSSRWGHAACGVADSVGALQVGREAHVNVHLRNPIDTPTVTVLQGGRRVEVSMRSGSRGAPIPDSVLFARDYDDTIGVVVIDPGHGGKDPGAVGASGLQEKEVTLKVALELRDLLRKAGLTVYMTRETDVFVGLRQRTRFANEKNADIFVSIHANAIAGDESRRRSVKGYKMYFLSQAKNEEDKLAAMLENSVVELEEQAEEVSDLQNILTEMVVNEYLRESQDLSILLAETFGRSLRKVPSLHAGVGQANFYVLNGAFMPSVLVEMAFISNPAEEKLLASESFQKSVATAIFEAVTSFKRKYAGGM